MQRLRWLLPALVVFVWLGAAGPLAGLSAKLTGLQENDVSAFLPDSAESTAVLVFLPLTPDLGDKIVTVVADLRAAIPVDGTRSYVTGPGGIFADFANSFVGIDGVLLIAAFGIVLLILLVVYRSPLLPLLV